MPPDVTPPPFRPPPSESTLPRFQFSLRQQLIVVTVACVLLGIGSVFGLAGLWFVWSILLWALPVPLVVTALFGTGELRVFSIGALIPWVTSWTHSAVPLAFYRTSGDPNAWLYVLLSMVVVVVMSGLCGWLAVRSHRWLERRAGDEGQK